MRIGCLQFAPQVGDVDNNLNHADAVLSRANPQNLDLLVLPELAFSGYNFRSLRHIAAFLEPTEAGITSLWARSAALKYGCVVTVGYPEKVDLTPKWPVSPEYYNSAITVNADGETIANYRKSFLYFTDEAWALEGPDSSFDGEIAGLGNVIMGIYKWPTKSFKRTDLNPYKYEASWNAHEFAFHILRKAANLVIISMAWITGEDAREFSRAQHEPDMDTLEYWLRRIEPLIRAETEGEIIVVFANRCGVEDEAVYAGTSAVLGIQGGEVKVYGMLGRGEEELLIVDTNEHPKWKLVSPTSTAAESERKEVKGPDDVRTNSAICGQSDTQSEDYEKSHPTVDAQRTAFTSLNLEGPPMEDIITPVSPVDASPHAYFAPKEEKHDGDTVKNPKQGIGHAYFSAAQPALPTFRWPISPESQNASPTRQLQRQVSTLISYDIALVVKSLPHPAAAAPGRCRSTITNNSFNTRRLHTSLRPKSALW